MNVAHVQVKAIPDNVDLTTLVELIVVANYYIMEPALVLYTQRWADRFLKGYGVQSYGVNSILLVFLATKFDNLEMFEHTALLAMEQSSGPLQGLGLSFPRNVLGEC
jgi:hypothetical protein